MLSSVQCINIGNSQNTQTTYYNLTGLNLNSLKRIGTVGSGTFALHKVGLSALNLPELIMVGGVGPIIVNDCRNLREINCPKLQYVGGYIVQITSGTTRLSGIYMNNLRAIRNTGSTTFGSPLSALYLGEDTLEQITAQSITCNQQLTQASVDSVLKAFARLNGTGGRTNFASSATLSLAGSNRPPSYTGGVS